MEPTVAKRPGRAREAPSPAFSSHLFKVELKAMAKLSLPLVGSFTGAVAISTTDVVMMGHLGPNALAAGALGYNLIFPLYLLGLGIILALAPLVAQALGAGDEVAVRRSVRQGLWAGTAVAVPFSAILWWGGDILASFGQDPLLTGMASEYLRVILWGLLPLFWYNALRSFLTAYSHAGPILVISMLAVALNILGNYAFMFGHFGFPRLELVGAGISTLFVDFFLFFGLFFYIHYHREYSRFALFQRIWRPDWGRFLLLFKLGIPIGLGIIAEAFFFSLIIFLSGRIGAQELAAVAIVIQIMTVAFMAPLGVSHAAMVRIGYHLGAAQSGRGSPTGVRVAAMAAMLVNFLVLCVIGLVLILVGDDLAARFLAPEHRGDGIIVALAASFVLTAAIFQFFDGLQIVAVGILRGLQQTKLPMVLAFVAFWGIGASSAWFMGVYLNGGITGVWSGLGLGLGFGASIALILAYRAVWRFEKGAGHVG